MGACSQNGLSPELVTGGRGCVVYLGAVLTMQKRSSQANVCDWQGVSLRRRIEPRFP